VAASLLASYYQIYSAFLRLVGRYATDPSLPSNRSAQAVCEAFIEAAERHLYTIVRDFDELRKKLPEQSFAAEELAKVLTGIIATRTSLHRNKPLRARIDELRQHSRGKSAKRERFEQLLKELPGQVLEVWDETAHPLGSFYEVRTEAARRIEKPATSSQELELAAFADREKLLKRAKAAKLSPQEVDVFELLITDPRMKPRDIARHLGLPPGQVRVVKHRINKKLEAVS
jgi:DNA-binding CsgD family transcriptional regulator